MPLRKGHTLIIPKTHFARLSELPPEFAAAVGEAVTKIAHAITQGVSRIASGGVSCVTDLLEAVDNTALNVVCNQEYAQAVHHVRQVATSLILPLTFSLRFITTLYPRRP